MAERGVMLKLDNKRAKTITTIAGDLTYFRYYLRPADEESQKRLEQEYGVKSLAPLDEFLGVDRIPFKATYRAALRIARVALEQPSYVEAERELSERYHIDVSDDTIRKIIIYLGNLDLREREQVAAQYGDLTPGPRRGRPAKNAITLYLELRTIQEGMLSIRAFQVKDGNPVDVHYMCNMGTTEELKVMLASFAIENGLGKARDVIILHDDSELALSISTELFPSAKTILSRESFYRTILRFADLHLAHYNNQTWRRKALFNRIVRMFNEGGCDLVLRVKEVERYEKPSKSPASFFRQFIIDNKEKLNYKRFEDQGLYTGRAISATDPENRVDAQAQMINGTWEKEGVNTYLALLSRYESGQWYTHIVPMVRKEYRKWPTDANTEATSSPTPMNPDARTQ